MKNKIFLFFTLFLLCVSLVKAGPTNPYIVYGWSYIDGQKANGMTVKLTNLDTGDSALDVSRDDGAFGFNLGNFPNGYSSDPNGHKIQYTYCIADTRCNERTSDIFIVSGQGGMQKDISAQQDGSGGQAPFIVFGTVKVNGVLKDSGVVTIKNTKTGITASANIDSEGYQFNLANMNLGYNTGDKIQVSYDAGATTTLEFTVIGGGQELDFDITTAVPGTPSPDGGGGGGGSITPGPGGANKINQGADILEDVGSFSFEGMEKSQFIVKWNSSGMKWPIKDPILSKRDEQGPFLNLLK